MTPPLSPGYPDYKANQVIADLYSVKYQKKFYYTSPIPLMTNSDFAADVNKRGDKVIIPVRPTITVKSYPLGGTMTMENPNAAPIEFPMNRSNYFYFGIDKITKKQMIDGSKFIDECTLDGGEQVNTTIAGEFLDDIITDAHASNKGNSAGVTSGNIKLGTTGTFPTLTSVNVLKYIIACEVVGDEQNWPDEGRFITLPSVVAGCIQLSDLKDVSLSGDTGGSMLRHGRLGRIGKMNILQSNQVKKVTDGASTCFHMPFGHMSALGFASNVIESVYFEKFESTCGEGMRVTNLYDWATVNSKGLGVLYGTADLGLD